jgi:hypothetical protein
MRIIWIAFSGAVACTTPGCLLRRKQAEERAAVAEAAAINARDSDCKDFTAYFHRHAYLCRCPRRNEEKR